MALIDELEAAIQDLDEDTAIRAVIVRGAGGENFSVGADIREFGAAAAGPRVK
jgi:enoyl-CoA hydratase/carnithine racemase